MSVTFVSLISLSSVVVSPQENNTAAIYVEIGAYDDDGDNIDDDMIGVFSKTFILEDFFSKDMQYNWEKTGDKYRITISDYPVYDSYHQATLIEIGRENAEKQAKHNRERLNYPSALISFHIDIELDEISNYPDFNTKIMQDDDFESFNIDNVNPVVSFTDANVLSLSDIPLDYFHK